MKPVDYENATPQQRCEWIVNKAKSQNFPESLTGALAETYANSRVLGRFIDGVIRERVAADLSLKELSVLHPENLRGAIRAEVEKFLPIAVAKIREERPSKDELLASKGNMYALAGATELSFANKITRTISTSLGGLWERIADISPYALDPDMETGIRLKGIDIIAVNTTDNELEFIQLKTTNNTLSGSQSDRTNAELRLHDNPVFAACFQTKTSWTYKAAKNVNRIAGAEFWERIGMDYGVVVEEVSGLILELEDIFVEMLNQ